MIPSGRKHLLAKLAVVAGLALLVAPPAALATFGMNIVGPGPYAGAGITVLDNAPGDLNPAVNMILFTAGLGGLPVMPGFTVSGDVSLTNVPGGPAFSLLDVNWTLSSLGGGTGGPVQVTASATDFTFPAPGTASILTSGVGGTITGTGSDTAQQWANLANLLFGLGPITPGLQGPFGPGAFSNTASTGFTSLTPFSITDRLTLTLGPESVTTGDLASQVTAVPEPTTLVLLGAGLFGLGAFSRRDRRH